VIGRRARLDKDRRAALSNPAPLAAGRAGPALVAAVALLGVGVLALVLWNARTSPARAVEPAPSTPSAERPAPGPEIGGRAPAPPANDARTEPRPPPELAPFAQDPKARVPGPTGQLGALRGHVESTGEEPFPLAWQLVLRPSSTQPARESAVSRTLEFTDGRQDFEALELPLGGYDVGARAQGYNGPMQPVLLEPGSPEAFVVLSLVPAGFLEGTVLDAQGLGAEGIPLTLVGVPESEVREAVTDVRGLFRFEALPDGAYELLVGRVSSPLLPERRPLLFRAPSMTFPDLHLPPLATLELHVTDSGERPLAGVEVRGSGTNGGLIERSTDAEGHVLVKNLPAGHYRLRFTHPVLGEAYDRRFTVELVVGQVTETTVSLGP